MGGLGAGILIKRQVDDLEVVQVANAELLGQLGALELKANPHVTVDGLDLNGLAVLVDGEEGHIVQPGVGVVEGVLEVHGVVEGLHVGCVVVVI